MMSNFKSLLSLSLLASSLLITGACTAELGGSGIAPDARDVGPLPDGPPPQVCDEAVQIRFEQRQLTPDIMIVLDRSGSMSRPLTNNGPSKWDIIRPALTNILITTETSVNYGLMLFPSNNQCARGAVRAAPTLNNGATILGIVNASNSSPNNGGTPTHQSLDEVRTYYANIAPNPDGRVVLLATDGLPTCGSDTGRAVNSINALSNQGISTYILGFGFGNDVDVSGLQQMANAGGTNQVYSADSPEQLQIALDAILGDITVPSCEFQLQETPSSEADINITFNGVELVRDDPTGWSYDAATKTISLLGASCDSVQNGGGDGIEVDLGCTGAVVD